jgi:hypothetical protein
MTDTTINYLSNHPMEQKLAAYRYYIKRMIRLPLSHTRQLREWQTILHIVTSNNFPITLLHKLKWQNTTQNNEATPNQKHWEQH